MTASGSRPLNLSHSHGWAPNSASAMQGVALKRMQHPLCLPDGFLAKTGAEPQ